MRLFIDGKLVQEAAPEKPLKLGKPDGPLHFGSGTLRGLKLRPANALIDGFRLSNQALYTGLKEVPVPTAAPATQ